MTRDALRFGGCALKGNPVSVKFIFIVYNFF